MDEIMSQWFLFEWLGVTNYFCTFYTVTASLSVMKLSMHEKYLDNFAYFLQFYVIPLHLELLLLILAKKGVLF